MLQRKGEGEGLGGFEHVLSYSGSSILVKPSKCAGSLPQRAMGIRDILSLEAAGMVDF